MVYTNHLWCLSISVFRKTPEFLSQAARGAFASVPRRYCPAVGTNALTMDSVADLWPDDLPVGCADANCDTMSHYATQIVTQFSPRYLKYCQ